MTSIVDGTERTRMLIADLLEYSRVSYDTMNRESVDCQLEFEETVVLLGSHFRAGRGGERWSPPVGQGPSHAAAQLFQNLMSNAIKFVADQPPRVHVSAEREHGGWCFACGTTESGSSLTRQGVCSSCFAGSPRARSIRHRNGPVDLQAHRGAPRRSHLGRAGRWRWQRVPVHHPGRSARRGDRAGKLVQQPPAHRLGDRGGVIPDPELLIDVARRCVFTVAGLRYSFTAMSGPE